jgi:lipopolysaccharide transport system permease protein
MSLAVLILFLYAHAAGALLDRLASAARAPALLLLSVGCSWLLARSASLVRDVTQITGFVTSALLFLSPVFYPVSAVPEHYRLLLYVNPLTLFINQSRDVLLWGRPPDWTAWAFGLLASLLVASLGLWCVRVDS